MKRENLRRMILFSSERKNKKLIKRLRSANNSYIPLKLYKTSCASELAKTPREIFFFLILSNSKILNTSFKACRII